MRADVRNPPAIKATRQRNRVTREVSSRGPGSKTNVGEGSVIDARIRNKKATGPILRRVGVRFRRVLAKPYPKAQVDRQRLKLGNKLYGAVSAFVE